LTAKIINFPEDKIEKRKELKTVFDVYLAILDDIIESDDQSFAEISFTYSVHAFFSAFLEDAENKTSEDFIVLLEETSEKLNQLLISLDL
jgi:hypothetical protein|tara:strand:+ start:399 stop:668 length:270 start_codon:yes stop_codon:yes gene_type:complete